jgi:DNA-directed RNA polymerase
MVDRADAQARQVHWEMSGINEGVRVAREAVREAETKGRVGETLPGRKIIKEVFPALLKRLTAAKAEACELVGGRGRPPGWIWPVSMVDADRLAVITLTVALRGGPAMGGAWDGSTPVTGASIALAAAVRTQIEYEAWLEEQHAVNAAVRKGLAEGEGVPEGHRNLIKAFKARYPDATTRAWGTWRAKIQATREGRWSKKDVSVPLGTKLIHELCEAAPDRFEQVSVSLQGATTAVLRLTEKTIEEMRDINTRMAVARPLMMPMIIKPNPWRYEDDN